MNRIFQLVAATLVALPLIAPAADAQEARIYTSPGTRALVEMAADRPMIGVTTAQESKRADTLGLLIEDVREDSPADKAGLKEGDRLQTVNGVSLRADRSDAGEEDYNGVLNRRLVREIQKTAEGGAIELRVLSGGQTRTVRVTPVKASELMGRVSGFGFTTINQDRAVLGLSIGSTGGPRDTLGVFVSAVTIDGPAEKAGIIEGDRIAAINGVSVRVAREDAADRAVGSAKANRLRREIAKLDAGDVAELTVVSAGRTRTVRVTSVKASELPGEGFGMLMPALEALRIRPHEMPKVEPHVSILRTFPKVQVEPRIRVVPRAPLMARTRTITI